MSELIDNFKKGWLDADPRLTAATLLGIFTFVILTVLLHKSEKRRKELKKNAVERSTAITAERISRHNNHGSGTGLQYSGTYRYTVNGAEHEYRISSDRPVPQTITLYPKGDGSDRFFSDYDRTINAGMSFNVLAGIAVCVGTLLLTGYIG